MILAVTASFWGCAPTHTLKEVVNDPVLILPVESNPDNPIVQIDQWMRKNMW